MKNVQRAVATSAMVLGLVGVGGATAFAQPTGSLGGDGPDIELSKAVSSYPGGCAVLVENIGTETAEGVTVKSPLGPIGGVEELGDIEAGESAKADFIDCQISTIPLGFYGTTTNGDTNLFNNFVIAYP